MKNEIEGKLDNIEFLISIVKRNQPYTMERHHYHNYYEIYFLLSGKREIFIKDTHYEVEKGSILFINQFDLHKTIDAANTEAHERIVVYFNDHFIEQFHGAKVREALTTLFTQKNRMLNLSIQQQTITEALMRQMYQEYIRPKSHHTVYLQGLLIQFLVMMVRIMEKAPEEGKPSLSVPNKMLEIIEYCNHNYDKPLTLTEIAQKCYMSPFHFSRLFKKTTGFTFIEYVNTLRVKEAQILIRNTNLKIIEISEQVGFSSLTHFGRVFKQITEVTPTEYKKMIHGS